MRIGYACLTVGVPGAALHTCSLKNADASTLYRLTETNLTALDRMLDYNLAQGVPLLRVSSDIVPFGSHPAVSFAWDKLFAERLAALGAKARAGGVRLSMHPGQYTVLNSPDEGVVRRALADLDYHCRFLDSLGMGPACKIILHAGGAYGDKPAALRRFRERYGALSPAIRRRLVIENDDKIFHIADVLALGRACGIPVVFDNLHNAVLPAEGNQTESEWIAACAATWPADSGPQKIHYSQQAPGKKPGSHSETIRVEPFLRFARALPPGLDIMLEVKDKNLSALKCARCAAPAGGIRLLEEEWARYKYAVLERSPAAYNALRALLKDKSAYPAVPFYTHIEQALSLEPQPGHAVNAAQHVWGYFKNLATPAEARRYSSLLAGYRAGAGSLTALKRHLYRLAEHYGQDYLLHSLYFYLD